MRDISTSLSDLLNYLSLSPKMRPSLPFPFCLPRLIWFPFCLQIYRVYGACQETEVTRFNDTLASFGDDVKVCNSLRRQSNGLSFLSCFLLLGV